jgi:uncharacterized membrane protein YfhO
MSKEDKKDKEKKTIIYKVDKSEYEIEIKKEEQKVKAKSGEGKDITVKDVESGFLKTTAKIDDKEVRLKWNYGFHLCLWIPIGLAVLFGLWFFLRKKKNKHEEEAL